jgi:L-asparagine transporter-like permease
MNSPRQLTAVPKKFSPSRVTHGATVTALPARWIDQGSHSGRPHRTVEFLSIGTTVGVCLGLYSSQNEPIARPVFLLALVLSGTLALLIMKWLGDLIAAGPERSAFIAQTQVERGPTRYVLRAWISWAGIVTTAMAELTAAGALIHAWLPTVPQWQATFGALLVLYVINRLIARSDGQVEFWMRWGKIIAMAGLRALCDVQFRTTTRFRLLSSSILRLPAFFGGCVTVALIAHRGTVSVAAAEPSAFFFFSPAISALMITASLLFLYALVSSCKFMLSSATEVLSSLATEGWAPASLAVLDAHGTPARAFAVTAATPCTAVLLSYFLPGWTIGLLLCAATLLIVINRLLFEVTHRLRRPSLEGSDFKDGTVAGKQVRQTDRSQQLH